MDIFFISLVLVKFCAHKLMLAWVPDDQTVFKIKGRFWSKHLTDPKDFFEVLMNTGDATFVSLHNKILIINFKSIVTKK